MTDPAEDCHCQLCQETYGNGETPPAYERRLATALEECIKVYSRAQKEGREVHLHEIAGIGDIIRGVLARVPWVEIDPTGVRGPSSSELDALKADNEYLRSALRDLAKEPR